ncbi:hypothetical protein M0R45_025977 [Rubus argutus]|uniref:Uncharacterized protein n=1 Tax=Rubus argutus TaxID=59490 RepID=A0AAW1WYN6_RUBAR
MGDIRDRCIDRSERRSGLGSKLRDGDGAAARCLSSTASGLHGEARVRTALNWWCCVDVVEQPRLRVFGVGD